MVFAFDFDLLDHVDHDVWLSQVNHAHGQAKVPVDEAVLAIVEALAVD